MVRTLNEFRTPAEIGNARRRRWRAASRSGSTSSAPSRRRARSATSSRASTGSSPSRSRSTRRPTRTSSTVAHAVKARLFGKDWRQERRRRRRPQAGGGAAGERRRNRTATKAARATPLASDLPRNMQLRLLSDQSVFIEESLSEVKNNAIEGSILAVLVLYAFLRRFKPTSSSRSRSRSRSSRRSGRFTCNGVSLNVMSLGGLAIGVGMLVDDSIVVLEAIERRRELGESAVLGRRQRHARDGARGHGHDAHDGDRVPPDRVRRRRRRPDLPRPGAGGRLQPDGVDGRLDGRRSRCSPPSSRRRASAPGRWATFGLRAFGGVHPEPATRSGACERGSGRRAPSLLWTVPLFLIQLPFELLARSSRSSSAPFVARRGQSSSSSARCITSSRGPSSGCSTGASTRFQAALERCAQGRAQGAAAHGRRRRGPHLARVARDGRAQAGPRSRRCARACSRSRPSSTSGRPSSRPTPARASSPAHVRDGDRGAGVAVASISSQVGVAARRDREAGRGLAHLEALRAARARRRSRLQAENAAREAVRAELDKMTGHRRPRHRRAGAVPDAHPARGRDRRPRPREDRAGGAACSSRRSPASRESSARAAPCAAAVPRS